jgi:3-deoxy-manno-octulosonate cytidylyltransferase (CMP-KDO synthetase)
VQAPIAVIPCRYASTRFPGKALALLLGRPMVQHVIARCREAACFSRVLVATDDARIAEAAVAGGAEAVLTSAACASGTDRVAEAVRSLRLTDDEVVVNVQGDEPAVHPQALATLARAFEEPEVVMATLVRPLEAHERADLNVVKAVLDERRNALYFSRSDIPFQRDAGSAHVERWAHLGLYGYRWRVLEELSALPPTSLERAESLEQLRALGYGVRIACRPTRYRGQAVDRPQDVPLAEEALRQLAS